jgi:hypothetical protein
MLVRESGLTPSNNTQRVQLHNAQQPETQSNPAANTTPSQYPHTPNRFPTRAVRQVSAPPTHWSSKLQHNTSQQATLLRVPCASQDGPHNVFAPAHGIVSQHSPPPPMHTHTSPDCSRLAVTDLQFYYQQARPPRQAPKPTQHTTLPHRTPPAHLPRL